MVNSVAEVGHGGVEIVVNGYSLDVEVTRHPVDVDVSRDHAARMFGPSLVGVRRRSLCLARVCLLGLCLPIFVPLISLELAGREAVESRNSAVRLVVRQHTLPVLEPAHGWEGLDLLSLAKRRVLNTVNLPYLYWHFLLLNLFRKLLPGGVEALAPYAPGSVKVDESVILGGNKVVKGVLGHHNGVDAVLVHLLEGRIVFLVFNLPNVLVATSEYALLPIRVHLPLLNILGNVLPVIPQTIPYVNTHVVTVKRMERNIKIDPERRGLVHVEGDVGCYVSGHEGREL
mmetsp:Transcript_8267/g.16688  ORF Transcript_8267/g.16688 Transcript_8267/m.16688 type:complete len:286 (+) Transcript_8267:461-1318(+)